MTPEAALIELLARLGAAKGAAVFVSAAELSEWPAEAVAALRSQRLLRRARPAATVVCPGCEESCTMPVNTSPAAGGNATFFVVCDKRDDINRVPVSSTALEQWRAEPEMLCEFVAEALEIRRSGQPSTIDDLLAIGVASGAKRRQLLRLRVSGEPALIAGTGSLPVADAIRFEGSAFTLDQTMTRQLVDASTTADPHHTPSNARREVRKLETEAAHEVWRRAYRELRKSKPGMSDVWYSQQIAKSAVAGGRQAETIRKHMKR